MCLTAPMQSALPLPEKRFPYFAENGHVSDVEWCLLKNGRGGLPYTSAINIRKPIFGPSLCAQASTLHIKAFAPYRRSGTHSGKQWHAKRVNGHILLSWSVIPNGLPYRTFMFCLSLPRPWWDRIELTPSRIWLGNRALGLWQQKNL